MLVNASKCSSAWHGQTFLKSPESLALFHHIKAGLGDQVYWAVDANFPSIDSGKMNLVIWEETVLMNQPQMNEPHFQNCEVVIGSTFSDALKERMKQRGISCYVDSQLDPDQCVFLIESAMQQRHESHVLNQKLQQNQSLSQYKSLFFSSVCHELKNPLNGISVAAEMLSSDMDLFRRTEYIEVIQTGVRMLHPIIEDIVDMTRIESGRVALKEKSFHLGRTLRDVVVSNRILAEQKGISLRIYFDDSISNILVGDPDRLKQVLFNLISNGIKYTDSGYVHLHCDLIETTEYQDCIRFQVIDSGYGIPKSYLDAIFEPFERADARPAIKGYGLGLTVAKSLVELMGGKLRLESQVGHGSRFEFDLFFSKIRYSG